MVKGGFVDIIIIVIITITHTFDVGLSEATIRILTTCPFSLLFSSST